MGGGGVIVKCGSTEEEIVKSLQTDNWTDGQSRKIRLKNL